MKTCISITIRVIHPSPGKNQKNKKRGISKVPKWLEQKITACRSIEQLHELFFSCGRKNKATMDAFIDKREVLEFDRTLSSNPHSSHKTVNHNGTHNTPSAAR